MSPILSASSIGYSIGANTLLKDLSLELSRGEILGLLGPNGAGKSTTLKILSGLLVPTQGSVELAGKPVSQSESRPGYLPETPPLYPEMSVQEYLRFCGRLHGLEGRNLDKACETVMDDCSLQPVSERLIQNLSKGYQQRTGIAQAILHRPDVIILDEPSVGLDPIQLQELQALIKRLQEQHAIIISSHLLTEVEAICTRVIILEAGQMLHEQSLDNDTLPGWDMQFSETPDSAQTNHLLSVHGAEQLGPRRFSVPTQAPLSEIQAWALQHVGGLVELRQQQSDLRRIYLEQISGGPSR